MNETLALARKDLRVLMRDKVGFFFTVFFPIIYASFFGMIFSGMHGGGGGSAGMKIIVVDEDKSAGSGAFVEKLKSADELRVSEMDRAEAAELVRKGKAVAFVALMPGFGEARERMFWGDPARIETGLDPSRSAEAGMLQGILTRYAYEGFSQMFAGGAAMQKRLDSALSDIDQSNDMPMADRFALKTFLTALKGFMAYQPAGEDNDGGNANAGAGFGGFGSSAWEPIEIKSVPVVRKREGPKNSYEVSFPQAIIWALLGCSAGFGISMVTERNRGTLVRLRMAPISRGQILGGKAVACFVTTVAVTVMLLAFGVIVFGVQPSSYGLLGMAVVCAAIAFVGIMMALSVVGKTEQSAGGIGWAILMVFAMLGGGMVPLFVMPAWMQQLSSVSPVKWAIVAMEGAIWRDYSLGEMLMPCGILVGVGLVTFAIGAKAFRWTES